jgi:hypothetical protein
MGFVASYPTSSLLPSDPLSVDIFLYYKPENFINFKNHPYSIIQNPANSVLATQLLDHEKTELSYRKNEDSDYEDDDEYPPFVGIPKIRISLSMAGDNYFKYTVA